MDQVLADACKIASELYSPYDSKAAVLLKELALVTALNGETQVSLRYHEVFASVVSVETLRGPVVTLPLFDRKSLKAERVSVSELRYTAKLLGFRTHLSPNNRIVLLSFLSEDPEGNGLNPKLSRAIKAVLSLFREEESWASRQVKHGAIVSAFTNKNSPEVWTFEFIGKLGVADLAKAAEAFGISAKVSSKSLSLNFNDPPTEQPLEAPMTESKAKLPTPEEFKAKYRKGLPDRAIEIFTELMGKYVDPEKGLGSVPQTEFQAALKVEFKDCPDYWTNADILVALRQTGWQASLSKNVGNDWVYDIWVPSPTNNWT